MSAMPFTTVSTNLKIFAAFADVSATNSLGLGPGESLAPLLHVEDVALRIRQDFPSVHHQGLGVDRIGIGAVLGLFQEETLGCLQHGMLRMTRS